MKADKLELTEVNPIFKKGKHASPNAEDFSVLSFPFK